MTQYATKEVTTTREEKKAFVLFFILLLVPFIYGVLKGIITEMP
ncbi:MAG: hypothetical protein ACXAD7_25790 [Candidatus Kariarchaeaceae archaeon]